MPKIDEDSPVSRWLRNEKIRKSSGGTEDETARLRRRVEQLEKEQRRRTRGSNIPKTQKSLAVGYILLLIFGHLGFHRFYCDFNFSGAIQLMVGITGWVVLWFFSIVVGGIILAVLVLWLIIDIALMPDMIYKAERR